MSSHSYLSAEDSASINDLLMQVIDTMLQRAEDLNFKLPYVIEVTDSRGLCKTFALSADYESTPLGHNKGYFIYPLSIVLSDGGKGRLQTRVEAPKRG